MTEQMHADICSLDEPEYTLELKFRPTSVSLITGRNISSDASVQGYVRIQYLWQLLSNGLIPSLFKDSALNVSSVFIPHGRVIKGEKVKLRSDKFTAEDKAMITKIFSDKPIGKLQTCGKEKEEVMKETLISQ